MSPTTAAPATTTTGLPRALELTAAVVAPTTLVTALMFYFGWSHAYYFCFYYGVNATLLDFTTQDYLMRSVDGLFVPVTILALATLVGIAAHRLLARRLDLHQAHRRGARWPIGVALLAALAGAILTTVGLAAVAGLRLIEADYAGAISLALGAIVVLWSVRLLRALRQREVAGPTLVMEWVATFVLVSISLFWATSDYSANVGTLQATANALELPTQPTITLFSERGLTLASPGVRETKCASPDSAYRFRYDGLVLVLESGNQLLLLPRRWAPGSAALLLPRSDGLRLEFRGTADPTELPATC